MSMTIHRPPGNPDPRPTGFTRASLPAVNPTGPGRIVRVTDGMRGLWQDNGVDWVPLNQHVLDVRNYGARCDNVTDDAAAIQTAIDVAGSANDDTARRRSGIVVLIPGPCAIGTTLLVHRKAIEIRGLGYGHLGGGVGINNPPKSYLRWIGAGGIPMLRIQDSFGGARVRDLRFIGHPTNKPSCAISSYETPDAQSNLYNSLDNIFIGRTSGETGGFDAIQFVNGILYEGTTLFNNDSSTHRNIRISGCDEYGVRFASNQNIHHYFESLHVRGCKYGIRAPHGVIILVNSFFSSNTMADFEMPVFDDFGGGAFAKYLVKGFGSEASKRLAIMRGQGILSIEQGYWQISAATTDDGQVVASSDESDDMLGSNSRQWLRLVDFDFTQGTAPPAPPHIRMRSRAGSGQYKSIILDQVRGWGAMTGGTNGLDIATTANTDRRYVFFRAQDPGPGAEGTELPRVAQNFINQPGADWNIDRYQNQATRIKTLVEATDTDLFSVSVPTSRPAAGHIDYCIRAKDLFDSSQAISGRLYFSAVASSLNVVVADPLVEEGVQNPVNLGTLTKTFVQATGTNLLTIKVNAVSSLDQNVLEISFDGPHISSGPLNKVTLL
jgi:hypothetical protein